MTQVIRLMVAVAAERLADIIEACTNAGATMTFATGEMAALGMNADDDAEHEAAIDRQVALANRGRVRPGPTRRDQMQRGLERVLSNPPLSAAGVTRANRQPTSRIGRRVLYTPMGTKKQLTALLDALRGQKTMRALVIQDLVKHPGSLNADVRRRIGPLATKYGLSVESVDNVIWSLVNQKVISKQAAE